MSEELIEELRATFEYHPSGYLIRKKNGKPCGRRATTHNGYAEAWVKNGTHSIGRKPHNPPPLNLEKKNDRP